MDMNVPKQKRLWAGIQLSKDQPDVHYQVLSKAALSESKLRDEIIAEWKKREEPRFSWNSIFGNVMTVLHWAGPQEHV